MTVTLTWSPVVVPEARIVNHAGDRHFRLEEPRSLRRILEAKLGPGAIHLDGEGVVADIARGIAGHSAQDVQTFVKAEAGERKGPARDSCCDASHLHRSSSCGHGAGDIHRGTGGKECSFYRLGDLHCHGELGCQRKSLGGAVASQILHGDLQRMRPPPQARDGAGENPGGFGATASDVQTVQEHVKGCQVHADIVVGDGKLQLGIWSGEDLPLCG